ncbi:hypothetical protein [Nocardia veterana]|uniref:Phosphopantetheine adenylyltransferase n=1 Tax=Nocardia veterana TaxID=132249 RepID=A0A7X6M1N2_9NOCA|nr:hypothetical protein [Nocardia veterana]NKY88618.1 hypothetical protein [Nocardia veterana]
MRRGLWGRLAMAAVAVLNLLPAVAVFSVDRAGAAYGIDPVDDEVRLIVRHRGVLFAILGASLLLAVFRPRLRTAAGTANAVSMAGFVALVPFEQPVSPALLRIARLDIAGLILLASAAVALREREGEVRCG